MHISFPKSRLLKKFSVVENITQDSLLYHTAGFELDDFFKAL